MQNINPRPVAPNYGGMPEKGFRHQKALYPHQAQNPVYQNAPVNAPIRPAYQPFNQPDSKPVDPHYIHESQNYGFQNAVKPQVEVSSRSVSQEMHYMGFGSVQNDQLTGQMDSIKVKETYYGKSSQESSNISSKVFSAFGLFNQSGSSIQTDASMTPPNADIPEDELPILEELGIDLQAIGQRLRAVLLFRKADHDLLMESDMCGPLLIACLLGFFLLLAGKSSFGYLYGLSIVGSISAYILLNLMSQNEGIDLYRTMSILGYALLPVVGVAIVSIFASAKSPVTFCIAIIAVLWCTTTASRFFESALRMEHQRFLVAYPIFVIYACFVLITIF